MAMWAHCPPPASCLRSWQMVCEGGCVGGPSQHKEEMKFKKDRDKLIAQADDRGVRENLENYDMKSFRMHK